jgi:dienelactone hydrolase
VGVLGRFRTAERRLIFVEPAHKGPAGDNLGPRKLLTDVRYPLAPGAAAARRSAAGPLPLIVFGPGFMQCGGPYSALLRSWASAGYVVATVNFPLSDCLTGAAATESDLVNQPADVSYVITRMLRLSAGRGFLRGRLSPHEIAISGQSDGGDTVAAVGANTCCTDHRLAAVAVLSGAQWPPMPGRFFARRPVPMLFTQGSADTVNLPGCSAAMYHADPARDRYYLDLFGADHLSPYWGVDPYQRVVARVTLAFFDRYVLGQVSGGPAMRRYGNVPGTAALLSHGGGHLPAGPCVT